MEEKKEQGNVMSLAFAATDKKVTESIPKLEENEVRGKGYYSYGSDNLYPYYLHSLYKDVTTLRTIIDGTSDFVVGDDAVCNVIGFGKEMNRKGDTIRDIIKWTMRDFLLYGGFALQIVRNKAGNIGEIYYLDFKYIRTDKYNECFWYSEDFDKKYARTDKTIVYPKYVPENVSVPASVFYMKNNLSTVYPSPRWSGAIKSCEIERNIDELHLTGLENGFFGSYIFNFNNGIPQDEEKGQIEKNINEKFCGSHNGGRVLINFANSKDNNLNLEKLEAVDFSDKYNAAAERSREQIYCAFGATPQIFGLNSAASGFSLQEFEEAFKLYNKTMVKALQRLVYESFDKIFNQDNSITIQPFTLD